MSAAQMTQIIDQFIELDGCDLGKFLAVVLAKVKPDTRKYVNACTSFAQEVDETTGTRLQHALNTRFGNAPPPGTSK